MSVLGIGAMKPSGLHNVQTGDGPNPWLYMGGSGKSNRFEFRFMWSHGRFDLLRTGMDNEMETLSSDI